MIDAVINLVELEGRIRAPAFGGDIIEPIKNPAVDEGDRRDALPRVLDVQKHVPHIRIIKKIS